MWSPQSRKRTSTTATFCTTKRTARSASIKLRTSLKSTGAPPINVRQQGGCCARRISAEPQAHSKTSTTKTPRHC